MFDDDDCAPFPERKFVCDPISRVDRRIANNQHISLRTLPESLSKTLFRRPCLDAISHHLAPFFFNGTQIQRAFWFELPLVRIGGLVRLFCLRTLIPRTGRADGEKNRLAGAVNPIAISAEQPQRGPPYQRRDVGDVVAKSWRSLCPVDPHLQYNKLTSAMRLCGAVSMWQDTVRYSLSAT